MTSIRINCCFPFLLFRIGQIQIESHSLNRFGVVVFAGRKFDILAKQARLLEVDSREQNIQVG